MAAGNVLAPAPIRTPLVDANGALTSPWVLYFQSLNLRAGGSVSQTVQQITNNITNIENNSLSDAIGDSWQGVEQLGDFEALVSLQPPFVMPEADLYLPEIQQAFDYEDGLWTPAFTSATVSGTVTAVGSWTKIGNQLFWEVDLDATAGSYTFSGSSINNLPYQAIRNSTFAMVNATTNADIGNGTIFHASAFLPTYTLTSQKAVLSGRHTWQ